MKNTPRSKVVRPQRIMRRLEFRLGYEDKLAGRGYRRDYDMSNWTPNKQLAYERGRMFAAFVHVAPVQLKEGNNITPIALVAWRSAVNERAMR